MRARGGAAAVLSRFPSRVVVASTPTPAPRPVGHRATCVASTGVNADEADHTTVYDSPARRGIPTSLDSGNRSNVQDVERCGITAATVRRLSIACPSPRRLGSIIRVAHPATSCHLAPPRPDTRSHQAGFASQEPAPSVSARRRSNNAQPRWCRWGTWLGSRKPACCAPALRLPASWPGIRIFGPPIAPTLGIARLTWIAAADHGSGDDGARSAALDV